LAAMAVPGLRLLGAADHAEGILEQLLLTLVELRGEPAELARQMDLVPRAGPELLDDLGGALGDLLGHLLREDLPGRQAMVQAVPLALVASVGRLRAAAPLLRSLGPIARRRRRRGCRRGCRRRLGTGLERGRGNAHGLVEGLDSRGLIENG